MKHSFKLLLVLLVATIAIFSSCKKYEDGPAISILSKKARLANNWVIEAYVFQGTTTTIDAADAYDLIIDKDGTYKYVDGTDIENGTWEFDSNKESVIFDKGKTNEITSKILRLKSKELWLENTVTENSISVSMEWHYKQK